MVEHWGILAGFFVGFAVMGFALKPKRRPKPRTDPSLFTDQHAADRRAHVHAIQSGFRSPKGRS